MYRSFIYLIVTVFLTGCFHQAPQPIVYPDWYNKPPNDNVNFYGVAKAANTKEAKQLARNMIMANILLTISKNDVRYKDVEEVKKLAPYIDLDGIEVKESEELENENESEFVVEVAIKQETLFTNEEKKLALLYNKIDQGIKELDTSSHAISQFAHLSHFEKISKEIDIYLSIIKVIRPSFKTLKFEQLLELYHFQMTELRLSMAIKIFSDADALKYIEVIQKAFAEREIVTLITSPSVKENITLKMSTDEQRYESQSFKMVKIQLDLDFYDERNKIIVSHKLILSGKSKQSYQDAKNDSAKYLQKLITTRGFFESLGL